MKKENEKFHSDKSIQQLYDNYIATTLPSIKVVLFVNIFKSLGPFIAQDRASYSPLTSLRGFFFLPAL